MQPTWCDDRSSPVCSTLILPSLFIFSQGWGLSDLRLRTFNEGILSEQEGAWLLFPHPSEAACYGGEESWFISTREAFTL
jgi:hypothetical protein